jgi:hypothetical protein
MLQITSLKVENYASKALLLLAKGREAEKKQRVHCFELPFFLV